MDYLHKCDLRKPENCKHSRLKLQGQYHHEYFCSKNALCEYKYEMFRYGCDSKHCHCGHMVKSSSPNENNPSKQICTCPFETSCRDRFVIEEKEASEATETSGSTPVTEEAIVKETTNAINEIEL